MYTEQYKILDIGTGRGGKYINGDTGVLRVGVDLEHRRLKRAIQQYPSLSAVEADVTEQSLPFGQGSFNEIQIYFPHGTLLDQLNSGGLLWEEFYRVLDPSGGVSILFDTFNDSARCPLYPISDRKVFPCVQMEDEAKGSGFPYTLVEEMTKKNGRDRILTDAGTVYSRKVQRGYTGSKVFQFLATK